MNKVCNWEWEKTPIYGHTLITIGCNGDDPDDYVTDYLILDLKLFSEKYYCPCCGGRIKYVERGKEV